MDETDSFKQLRHPALLHNSSTERHYTVSSVCMLQSKFLPLQGEKLKDIQDTFNNVDIRFIDEKSMVGQNIFTIVSKRPQEARPHYDDNPFGNILVVLLGDSN